MRKVSKFAALLIIVMSLILSVFGCSPKKEEEKPGPDPTPETPAVTSIEITNTQTTVGPEGLTVTAKCLPDGSEQGFTVSLEKAPAFGVTLDDKTLNVHKGTENGEVVTVKVASTADPSKTATKDFTVDVSDVEYTEIANAEELQAIGASEESLAGAYILKNDIVLEKVYQDNTVPMKWTPFEGAFTGVFEGNGYSIKGIDAPNGGEFTDSGFFGDNYGVIRNVGFDNAEYPLYSMNMGADSGVIAGTNRGVIKNVYTNVAIMTAGGTAATLVGNNEGVIEDSYSRNAAVTKATDGNTAGVVGKNSGTVENVVADREAGALEYFVGAADAHDNAELNAMLKDSYDMQSKETYTALKWDDKVWYFENVYPMLKNASFDPEYIEKTVKITSPTVLEMGGVDNKQYQLTADYKNCVHDEVVWAIDNASSLEGVTIDAATGILTFADAPAEQGSTGKLDGKKLSISLSLADDPDVADYRIIEVRDDGYDPETGIVVSTEQELYDIFFKGVTRTKYGNPVATYSDPWTERAMTRTIKLGADIQLETYSRWPGVDAFYGVFDGQGHTISGLAVEVGNGHELDGYDFNVGYGFFREVGDQAKGRSATIKNVVLKDGWIKFSPYYNNAEHRYLGGLVQKFNCGVISNVLVDLELESTTNYMGMIVGSMIGSTYMEKGVLRGSTRLESSIAMGKLTSTLPMDAVNGSEFRMEWQPFACGALVGKTNDPAGVEIVNCYAMGEAGEPGETDIGLTNRSDASLAEYSVRVENIAFKTMEEFQLASTFVGHGFDEDIWFFEDGYYPTLRYENFVKPEPVPSIVTITNKGEAAYDYLGLTDGYQIETKVVNPKDKTVQYSIDPAVTGASISDTGLITFTEDIADNTEVTVKVTLGEGTQGDSWTFRVYNDGYDPATGLQITNEAELYSAFFPVEGVSTADTVARNMTRKIVLMNDIVLDEYANWPGVPGVFSGYFNGNGHTISGFNVDKTGTASDHGYGFFKEVRGKTGEVVIENVAFEGELVYHRHSTNAPDHFVGGVAQLLSGGIIRNVLVDMNMTSDINYVAKVVGQMTNNCAVENTIALGTVKCTMEAELNEPGNDSGEQRRPSWAPNGAAAFVAKPDAKSTQLTNCWAYDFRTAEDTDVGFGCRDDAGINENCTATNWGFKTLEELQSGTPLDGFDTAIWNFVEGEFPSLKALN